MSAKNIGFLIAMKKNSKIILETDDDGVLKWTEIWETIKKWWIENGKGPKPKQKDLKKMED